MLIKRAAARAVARYGAMRRRHARKNGREWSPRSEAATTPDADGDSDAAQQSDRDLEPEPERVDSP